VLEADIAQRRQRKDILLMTHIVLGYPSFDDSRRIVATMVDAGVDLMELQIPFSEPIADGPVILHANQRALAAGSTVDRCLELTAKLSAEFPIPFLFMSYYNVAFVRGARNFAEQMREAGVRGAIIPDLPFEEGDELFAAMTERNLDPIFIYAPNTDDERMRAIAARARGFIYCVARKGVTGAQTEFASLDGYLARCRASTKLPLALGFGVQNRADIDQLRGKVDIAVVGSQTLRIVERDGVAAVGPFIRSLTGAQSG
jgi:tryptophan synthase alpha chain